MNLGPETKGWKCVDENVDCKLLAVAHMYQVIRLKMICEEKLAAKLDVQNVTEIWHVAHLQNATELAANAIARVFTKDIHN